MENGRFLDIVIFKRRVLYIYKEDGIGRFRIYFKNNSWGWRWKDVTKHDLSFSERHGFGKHYRIGKYLIRKLIHIS